MKLILYGSFFLFFGSTILKAQTQTGKATYYHMRFWGRKTTSGEPYHPYVFSAAHRTLPFGTWVEVELPKTGKKTLVRINDRGPFIRGGLIDLSLVAAEALGLVPMGVSSVIVRPLTNDELTDSVKIAFFKRDSLTKVEHPTPYRAKSPQKKKRKKR
jgi:rare lipoprotein A